MAPNRMSSITLIELIRFGAINLKHCSVYSGPRSFTVFTIACLKAFWYFLVKWHVMQMPYFKKLWKRPLIGGKCTCKTSRSSEKICIFFFHEGSSRHYVRWRWRAGFWCSGSFALSGKTDELYSSQSQVTLMSLIRLLQAAYKYFCEFNLYV